MHESFVTRSTATQATIRTLTPLLLGQVSSFQHIHPLEALCERRQLLHLLHHPLHFHHCEEPGRGVHAATTLANVHDTVTLELSMQAVVTCQIVV